MTIQEAIKAHESGKKVRHRFFITNERVITFKNDGYATNFGNGKMIDYTINSFDGWEIVEEPLTADELRKGIKHIIQKCLIIHFTNDRLTDLLNNKRIWEE